VTSCITAVQRIAFVHRATQHMESKPIRIINDPTSPPKAAGIAATRRAKS
jgi:hypothetical protein